MKAEDVQVGMRVTRTAGPGWGFTPQINDKGTVQVLPKGDDTFVGVRWDGFTKGHDNDLGIEDQQDGWFVAAESLEPICHTCGWMPMEGRDWFHSCKQRLEAQAAITNLNLVNPGLPSRHYSMKWPEKDLVGKYADHRTTSESDLTDSNQLDFLEALECPSQA